MSLLSENSGIKVKKRQDVCYAPLGVYIRLKYGIQKKRQDVCFAPLGVYIRLKYAIQKKRQDVRYAPCPTVF